VNPKTLTFSIKGDERGSLIALQANIEIPFQINRVYYIYATQPEIIRGLHAHRELRQVAVCVSGKCKFILDDGNEKCEVVLDSPEKGLFIDQMIWREMTNFSRDCVLLVLADKHYDENDYIRNYQEFLRIVNDK
jgi:dTDP-4-dehydrorhamnose 3,5-epimerase-like enzyme